VELNRPLSLLVVEDDDLLRSALIRQLRRIGHRVVAAENGQALLDYLQRTGRPEADFNLLLSDVEMPELGGRALAGTLRARGWTLPILLMSGHLQGDALPADVEFLAKPFAAAQLIEILGRLT
jgi:two-component system cell cycle sensor histidine kinase/response regulator CckA